MERAGAGREMDAVIAERVMGWVRRSSPPEDDGPAGQAKT